MLVVPTLVPLSSLASKSNSQPLNPLCHHRNLLWSLTILFYSHLCSNSPLGQSRPPPIFQKHWFIFIFTALEKGLHAWGYLQPHMVVSWSDWCHGNNLLQAKLEEHQQGKQLMLLIEVGTPNTIFAPYVISMCQILMLPTMSLSA